MKRRIALLLALTLAAPLAIAQQAEPASQAPRLEITFENAGAAGTVLIRNATVWTQDEDGVIENADLLMRDGKIEQEGAPLQMFQNPVSRFVASFLGSPSMNFVPGRLAAAEGGLAVAFEDGRTLALPAARVNGLEAGREVVFGVRTEHISRTANGRGDLAPLEVPIDVIQPTGTRTYATFQIAGHPVMAELEAHDVDHTGQHLSLLVDMNRIVLIDPTTDLVIT
jgi:multiple sugar transport system ATP-binding protein